MLVVVPGVALNLVQVLLGGGLPSLPRDADVGAGLLPGVAFAEAAVDEGVDLGAPLAVRGDLPGKRPVEGPSGGTGVLAKVVSWAGVGSRVNLTACNFTRNKAQFTFFAVTVRQRVVRP
ncbi:hypothetical protein ACFU6K_35215 [Kitasatospora sp. NPDC057512]|uniref:hypothetical protein n=1 Tax=Kitasatospora sp. NPDC057512 TaxID=3346154 RepID=UPI0036B00C78